MVERKAPSEESLQKTSPYDLRYIVDRLEKISSHLRIAGNVVFVSTLANLFSTFAVTFFSRQLALANELYKAYPNNYSFSYSRNIDQQFLYVTVFLASLFFCFSIFSLLTYDRNKKQGNVLFEELSDELEWRVKETNNEKKINIPKENPVLRTRIALREYTYTTELPLVKGQYSITLYFILNIVLLILTGVFIFYSGYITL
jgi:hypothetical protein